ncbi:hypothetical protein [Saccharothrix xinjiangensis]|uniref:Uncharacterized protein n=1 Tax=Saccharothrix xinjiangensis TaxID=204798 RepID=A0ABV9YBM1_9PSEU
MREHRREVARLCRLVVDRSRWQLAFAVVVSAWSLAWVVGQVFGAPGPLDVLPARWAGLPTGWLDAAGAWAVGRTGFLAVAGGLLWAMTSPGRQSSALCGWLAVMAAAEDVGYVAVKWALAVFAVFLAVMGLVSLTGRRAFVVDRVAVIPKDVVRAGATAAALSAVVPLLAPGLALARLVGPYLTRPPRPAPAPIARARSAERPPPAEGANPVPAQRAVR